MKYTEALQKRAGLMDGVSSAWKKHVEAPVNAYIKKNYTDPQTGNAYDNFKSRLFNDLGAYSPSILIGGGVAGLGAFGIAEWINSRRKKDEQKLPTGILTMLASIGGGIGGAYLWDKYNKTASDLGELQPVADPSLMVPPEEQEALEDPSGKKKKKTEKPDNIQQMIYAQKAKQRRQAMKMASLTYSKVAALMKESADFDIEQDRAWEEEINRKTNQLPVTTQKTPTGTVTQGSGTFRFGKPAAAPKIPAAAPTPVAPITNTNFTTPKTVQPVQPPQYRQADTTVKDVEGFR